MSSIYVTRGEKQTAIYLASTKKKPKFGWFLDPETGYKPFSDEWNVVDGGIAPLFIFMCEPTDEHVSLIRMTSALHLSGGPKKETPSAR